MARKNAIVTVTADAERNALVFNVVGAGALYLMFDQLNEEVMSQATTHGLKQRISDAAALGAGATPQQKYEAMKRLVDHYNSGGSWELTREKGERVDIVVIDAFAALKGFSQQTAYEELSRRATGKEMSLGAYLKIVAHIGPIAAKVAELRLERASDEEAVLVSEIEEDLKKGPYFKLGE